MAPQRIMIVMPALLLLGQLPSTDDMGIELLYKWRGMFIFVQLMSLFLLLITSHRSELNADTTVIEFHSENSPIPVRMTIYECEKQVLQSAISTGISCLVIFTAISVVFGIHAPLILTSLLCPFDIYDNQKLFHKYIFRTIRRYLSKPKEEIKSKIE